ncbi:ABC transporter substrate-binding protein [Vibrio marisflavi]|nr:ABC transporter substrate binding protein [Vibrio marisflavi]
MAESNPFRVLHVMSYHKTWKWNIEQFQGFKDGIGDIEVEYQIIELDTKRDSSQKSIQEKVAQTHQVIETWKPNLLYINDDNAQKYVSHALVNSDLPVVFSGVNRDPSEYDFLGSSNVTGVLEHEHFVPTVNLVQSLSPNISKIAVIVDSDPTWKGVMTRMRANSKHLRNIEVTEWILVKTFDEYKQVIERLQTQVDSIALLGIFNLKNQNGKDVPYEEVLKWTVKNSQLPDFSFWESRVNSGTLAAVAVSGYDQGYIAGQMAKKILVENIKPSEIDIRPSYKGVPMISLPRAKALGLNPNVQVLLNNTIKRSYTWGQ